MGEIFVISEESMEEEEEVVVVLEEEEEVVKEKEIGLEKFLPRMDIRVLLVEADDCTRKILAALLRKCGYRVTAVADASKAWEMLKERPQDIDLVLTEVELPSISGLSLLAMMMEHKICKNLPVIMMSSNDSIGVVYKCMLRGAVDFLVKPVRKNELRILWQHVWRRESSSSSGQGLQDGIAAQPKNGASSENHGESNHSSNFFGNSQSNKQCSDKESDAQSSCTKREMEDESPYVQSTQGFLKPKSRSPIASDVKLQNENECVKSDERMPMDEREQQPTAREITQHKNAIEEIQMDEDHIPESNCKQIELSREAIDLIGSFDEHRQACRADVQEVTCNGSKIRSGSYDIRNESSSGPVLELSLMQYNQSGYGNQKTDEICTMSHSNMSPFSQYNNRILQPRLPTLVNAQPKPKGFADKSHQQGLTQDLFMSPQPIVRSSQASTAFPFPQLGVLPHPDPSSQKSSGCGSALPPMFYAQSCPQSSWNPSSDHQRESPFFLATSQCSKPAAQNVEQGCDQDIDNSANQTVHQHEKQNLDDMETPMHVTTSTSQSGTSSLCNDEGLLVHDGTRGTDPHRSIQRELALTKFRLKRKDRCFEKKVRYQSRKRLAEQRPRVKGQFVRQIPTDLPLTYTNC